MNSGLSDRMAAELRARIQVDTRSVFWKTCRDGRVQSVCPRCRPADYWWSTPAVSTQAQALKLLDAHLRERHRAHLVDHRDEMAEQQFIENTFAS